MTGDIDFLNSKVIVSDRIFSYLGLDGYTKDEDYLIKQINESIEENHNQFFINIREFINIYIQHVLNPTSGEDYNLYNNSKAKVEYVQNNLSNISNYIDEQTNNINEKIQNIKNDIEKQQKSYKFLLKSLGIQEEIDHDTTLMTDESVDLYKIQYIKNIILIIGVIILIIMLIKVYNK
jgi:gas vesicle protein